MVRVNLINPKFLTDEHLNAENVELDMLLAFINKYPQGHIPESYRLGKGHMSFFRDKTKFVMYRKALIQAEMKRRRGLEVETAQVMEVEWLPTQKDIDINISRILERLRKPLRKKTPWHYCSKPIYNIEEFIKETYQNQNIYI